MTTPFKTVRQNASRRAIDVFKACLISHDLTSITLESSTVIEGEIGWLEVGKDGKMIRGMLNVGRKMVVMDKIQKGSEGRLLGLSRVSVGLAHRQVL